MKAIAINGSPRKKGNTVEMLNKALEGAQSAGVDEVELVHLASLDFKGCTSCFRCTLKDAERKCHYQDDLTPVLERIADADLLFVGSPMYICDVTGMTRNFVERVTFQYISYDFPPPFSYFDGRIETGWVFTMNCPKEAAFPRHEYVFFENSDVFRWVFNGVARYVTTHETWQFNDYSKYSAAMFDVEDKRRIREEVFPMDLQSAFNMGRELALVHAEAIAQQG